MQTLTPLYYIIPDTPVLHYSWIGGCPHPQGMVTTQPLISRLRPINEARVVHGGARWYTMVHGGARRCAAAVRGSGARRCAGAPGGAEAVHGGLIWVQFKANCARV